MKKSLIISLLCLWSVTAYSQVGIGTTTPDASSVLDVSATDKGILIPRVSLNDVTNSMLDGTNVASAGLLIWNANASTTGGSGIGFYYFDGTIWVALGGGSTDADWYEEGTSNAPNAISDNIFTNGNVGINASATASRQLNVQAASTASETGYFINVGTGTGAKTGIRTVVTSNTNAPKHGIFNFIGSIDNGGTLYGTYNSMFGANNETRHGTYNTFSGGGAGDTYGVYSIMNPLSTGRIWGAFNNITNDEAGDKVGVENRLSGSGGRKYGTLNEISSNGTLPAYGSFNRISGTGSGFMYGSYNEINGTGTGTHIANYSAASSSTNDNVYASYNSVNANGTGPHFGTYNVLSGTGTGVQFASYNDVNITGNGIHYGSQTVISGAANFEKYGSSVRIDNTGSGAHFGSTNTLEGSGTGAQTAVNNFILNTGNATHTGTNNVLTGTGSGIHYGTHNLLQQNGSGLQHGIFNEVQNTGNNTHYGSRNSLNGPGTGDKYGSHNYVDPAAGGTHFGVYSDVQSQTSFAGYFKGRFAVGTNDVSSPSPDFYILPPSRGTANQIIQTDANGLTFWTDNTSLLNAENGLSAAASTVRLGGSLNQSTTVAQGNFDLNWNLSGTGDFNVQDNAVTHLQVRDNGNTYFGGEAIVTENNNVAGATTARLFNIFGQDGALYLYQNGQPQHRLDAGFITIFNDLGNDLDFRVESDTNPQAFGINAGEDVMYAGTNIVSLTNNGALINGVNVEYVASFYRNDLTNGTAVQLGSTEYITDFGNLILGPYGSWAPYLDNAFDLGTSVFRWDDVYATSGVVNTSDIRLKKNIKPLEYGLAEILQIEPIAYQWKNSRNPSEVKIGFSAQQLLEVLPETVKTHDFVYPDENGPGILKENENLGVYYSDIIPVLTKAIQEQNALIEALQNRIEKLEKTKL